VGIASSGNEWIAFTDDDTLPDEEWLNRAEAFIRKHDVRVVSGRICPDKDREQLPGRFCKGRSGRVASVGSAIVEYDPTAKSGVLPENAQVPFGANAFIRRDVFEDYGGYDEILWRLCGKKALGVDDGEFGVRIQAAGELIGYCREAVVVHPVHAERFSFWSHMKVAYAYGWRDSFVFFDSNRPAFERFRLRLMGRMIWRLMRDVVRNDPGGALADVVDISKQVGCIVGRLSPQYREWCRLKSEGWHPPAP